MDIVHLTWRNGVNRSVWISNFGTHRREWGESRSHCLHIGHDNRHDSRQFTPIPNPFSNAFSSKAECSLCSLWSFIGKNETLRIPARPPNARKIDHRSLVTEHAVSTSSQSAGQLARKFLVRMTRVWLWKSLESKVWNLEKHCWTHWFGKTVTGNVIENVTKSMGMSLGNSQWDCQWEELWLDLLFELQRQLLVAISTNILFY